MKHNFYQNSNFLKINTQSNPKVHMEIYMQIMYQIWNIYI